MKNIQDIEKVENLLKIGDYETLYRVNYNGQRIYVRENPFQYYSGLTGALSAATFKGSPDNKRMSRWRDDLLDAYGKRQFDDYMGAMADFGTLTHMALVTIQEDGKIDWSLEEDKAWDYFVESYKSRDSEVNSKVIKKMIFEYLKQVGSLMQFIHDRVHEIYAIETPAWSDVLKIATPIDLFCSCRQTPKGDFKNTCINLKTSNQIGDHQLEQISVELHLWNETYGNSECAGILRGKNWRDGVAPTYEYKGLSQEDALARSQEAIKRLFICYNSDATYYPNPTVRKFKGVTKIGETPNIVVSSLEDEWEEAK